MAQHLPKYAHLRIPILLLGALLLITLTISGLTLYALKGQRAELSETFRESQEHALTLIANRIEGSLLDAVRAPFLVLKNIPQEQVSEERMRLVRSMSPAVEQILFLDREMGLTLSFPPPLSEHERRMNQWIAQRVQEEQMSTEDQALPLDTFVETFNGRPTLFAFQPITDLPSRDTNAETLEKPLDGWMLMRFNMAGLKASAVAPLLAEFDAAQGGSTQLRVPESSIGEDSLSASLTRVLPGWTLVFDPLKSLEEERLNRQSWAILGVAGGALLTIAITGFALWWEVRREYALVELRNRFVANVSHELKTPLSLIRMYAETLYLRRLHDPQKQHEYHGVILREAERLSQMITNVLDFARLRAGVAIYHLTETDLRATVSRILEHYQHQIEERGVRLEVSLPEQLPPVAHDPNGVTQLLLNLLDNAVKYGATGGAVQVRVVDDLDWVELQVADFGPGIPVEEHARLRQAFESGRMPETARGSGLGLALVEQIAASHRAHFILDTPEDHSGVKAVVSFPSYQGKP